MFAGEIAVGQSLLNAIFYLLCRLFQLHSAQFLHHSFGLLPGCFLDLLGVDRFDHLGHNLYLGARRYRLRSYRTAWVSFSASASSSSLSVSSTLSRTNSFSCPFITSSFSCTIFQLHSTRVLQAMSLFLFAKLILPYHYSLEGHLLLSCTTCQIIL